MNKKKIIIIIVSAVLVAALLAVGAVLLLKNLFKGKSSDTQSGDTAGTAVITVADAEGKSGEKIRVSVNLSENPGFMAAMLEFKYDSSALEYVTYYKGDFLTDYTFQDDNGVLKFVGVENEDTAKNGTLFELEFKVKENAEASEISVNTDSSALCNFDEKTISVKGNSGKITVK